jgi:hypothetical protein
MMKKMLNNAYNRSALKDKKKSTKFITFHVYKCNDYKIFFDNIHINT